MKCFENRITPSPPHTARTQPTWPGATHPSPPCTRDQRPAPRHGNMIELQKPNNITLNANLEDSYSPPETALEEDETLPELGRNSQQQREG